MGVCEWKKVTKRQHDAPYHFLLATDGLGTSTIGAFPVVMRIGHPSLAALAGWANYLLLARDSVSVDGIGPTFFPLPSLDRSRINRGPPPVDLVGLLQVIMSWLAVQVEFYCSLLTIVIKNHISDRDFS